MISSEPETDIDMKGNGRSFPSARWFFSNLWAILTLVIVTIASVAVIRIFKKPGQMSVIEAQSMDVSTMVPARGAVPVAIAKVEYGLIEGSITYTGTVQAYEDEDVLARVTGRIAEMPVYPGDCVRKGQLLVLLDNRESSEYEARRTQAVEARNAALHEAGVSKLEFKQKQHLHQAAIDAEKQARKAIEEAQASLSYWGAEIKRQEALLVQQVVSQQEYDAELAQFRTAQAKVDQARARLSEATNNKIAAEAAFEAEVHHIGHQFAQARKAEAAMKEAGVIENYTRIRARAAGVVVKRLLSPGVVASAGMPILKVARINKVRVQAEVASTDLDRIRVGSPVIIKRSEDSARELVARVTSIFPAADPASRTSVVEALVDNQAPVVAAISARSVRGEPGTGTKGQVLSASSYRFLPGQYVVMTISTGSRRGPVIPTSAVVWREGKSQVWKVVAAAGASGAREYRCPMHNDVRSDKPGQCPQCGMDLQLSEMGGQGTAALVDIGIGLSSADKTEVTSGLSEGDHVVFQGYSDLQPGMAVVSTAWGKAGPLSLPTASEVGGAENAGHRH